MDCTARGATTWVLHSISIVALSNSKFIEHGDCGSWVVEPDTGALYGYITAGDPKTAVAYIIPAYQVFHEISQRMGSNVTLKDWLARTPIYGVTQNNDEGTVDLLRTNKGDLDSMHHDGIVKLLHEHTVDAEINSQYGLPRSPPSSLGFESPRTADPLGVLASLLVVATAGVQSTQSLKTAVKRYKTRDTTLRRLLNEIGDAENILCALEQLLKTNTLHPIRETGSSIAVLLHGPIKRYSKICIDFKGAMEQFSSKSKTNFVDWTKMEFIRGDINQFIDTVTGYKATILVGFGVLTM